MKKIFFIFILLTFVFLFGFKDTQAVIQKPFGGRIITYPIPGIICPGNTSFGQFAIIPSNVAPPTPYTPLIENPIFKIRPGVFIKGNFTTTPLPICFTDAVIPIPIPTFPVTFYATSQKPSF